MEAALQAESAKEARLRSSWTRKEDPARALTHSVEVPPGAGRSARSPRSSPRVGGSLNIGIAGRPSNRGSCLGDKKTDPINEETIQRLYDDRIISLRTEIDQLQARHTGLEKMLRVAKSENTRLSVEDSGGASGGVLRQSTAPGGASGGCVGGKKLGVVRQQSMAGARAG